MRRFSGDVGGVLGERFSATGWFDHGIDDPLLEFIPHGGHAAQFGDDFAESFDHVINVFFRVVFAERHDDVPLSQCVIEANRAEDMRNLQRFADAT